MIIIFSNKRLERFIGRLKYEIVSEMFYRLCVDTGDSSINAKKKVKKAMKLHDNWYLELKELKK